MIPDSVVSVAACRTYDREVIERLLAGQLEALGISSSLFSGKHVVIKPNLVSARNPDQAATTHPAVLTAVGRLIAACSPASLTIAESPGGPYTELTLRSVYRACQTDRAAAESGVALNTATGYRPLRFPDSKVCREFNIIDPIANADVIVDLCKLKTHSLTRMTCAVKNFFGVVPGIQKFEFHSRFPDPAVFQEMIVDLASGLCGQKTVLAICDAVYGMEGNGPSNGSPRAIGALLVSRSPFALDILAEHLLGFDGTVPLCNIIAARGLVSRRFSDLQVVGDDITPLCLTDCREPDAQSGWILKKLPDLFGGKLARAFQPRPLIDKERCVGCGKCRDSCPVHTIELVDTHRRKQALIHKKNCIHCFCCQELCPFDAVKIKKNVLIRLAH